MKQKWVFVTPTTEAMQFVQALADRSLTAEQRHRLSQDNRLMKPCEACGHPGYMHSHAEEQYENGPYGVPLFEAGDIECEAEGCDWNPDFSVYCGWYEGDNWRKA